jgi:hypothetical protein
MTAKKYTIASENFAGGKLGDTVTEKSLTAQKINIKALIEGGHLLEDGPEKGK